MKKQILIPMTLAFFFLIGEAFAGNGMMNRVLVNTNPMSNLEIHHHQPDSSSMKTHSNMQSKSMEMQKSGSMGKMMKHMMKHMMKKIGNMKGMNPAKRKIMKQRMKKMGNMKGMSPAKCKMMMKKMGMSMKGMGSATNSMMMKKHMSMRKKMGNMKMHNSTNKAIKKQK